MKRIMKTVEGFRLRTVMGQPVIVGEGIEQIDFSKLVTLNASAAYLWQSVEGRTFTTSHLAALLVQRYDIAAHLAQQDACSIVEAWTKNGLIELIE